MHLQAIDWVIVSPRCLLLHPGALLPQTAGRNTSEFFVSGRAVPWWLAGLSMVATTFSSDTRTGHRHRPPERRGGQLGLVGLHPDGGRHGLFYARMWRRSEVMTDLEL